MNNLPNPPETVDDVYETHKHMISHCGSHLATSLVGYKMGAVGLVDGEPCFYGPLFKEFLTSCPMPQLSLSRLCNCHTLEVEIGFVMKTSLPVKSNHSHYTLEEVWDAVDSVVGCVELCGSRFDATAMGKVPVLQKLADGLMTGGVHMGPPLTKSLFTIESLRDMETSLSVNGAELDRGSGSRCPQMGPMESLLWLVEKLHEHDRHIEAGQLVISGMTAKTNSFQDGDTICASFSGNIPDLTFTLSA